jgi:hypothetical protein
MRTTSQGVETANLLLPFSHTNKYFPSLTLPNPQGQKTIQDEVEHTGSSGVVFGGFPAQLPIEVECCSRYYDRGVASGKSNVCVVMRLLECVGRWEFC